MKTKINFAVLFSILCVISFFPPLVFASSPGCPFVFTRTLTLGSTGDDVLKLQQLLNTDADTMIALSGLGSLGNESNFFGVMTKKAVIKFQEKYKADTLTPAGLISGSGVVGSFSRQKLNALCAVASVPAPVKKEIVESTLTVSAGEQPAPSLFLANTLRVPFTNVVLTAGSKDVTVNKITIERVGPAKDQVFYSVGFQDADGVSLGDQRAFHTDHTMTTGDGFVIPAGTSKTITLIGNAATDFTDYNGQVVALQLKAIDADAPIIGALPVRGSFYTINSTLTIGALTAHVSAFDPGTARRVYVNDTNTRFAGITVTAGTTEDVRIKSMTWTQNGSASFNDISNIVTVVNGVAYPTERDDKLYTSVFGDGLVLKKGSSLDMYVKGDIGVTGANRTVKFDVRYADDIEVVGESYGFGIYPTADANTATQGESVFLTTDGSTAGLAGSVFYSAPTMTISGGAFNSVSK